MRKALVFTLVFVVCALMLAACAPAATTQPSASAPVAATNAPSAAAASPAKQVTIGYIQAGPDVYYMREVDGVRHVVETLNKQKLVVLNSEYKQEKELSNADDLIAQKVDAIILMPTNADAAQKIAQKCNAANIPFFLSAAQMANGPGKATGSLLIDMVACGKLVGDFTAKNYPNTKGYIITGVLGQGVGGDDYGNGFRAGIKDAGIKILDTQPGNWDRNTAMKKAQDMLTADPNVQFIYVENEDMAMGVATVLKDMNLLDKIALVSQNGSPTGVEMLKNGQLKATAAGCPTLAGMTLARMALDYLGGKTADMQKMLPMKLVTPDKISDLDPWDLQELLTKYNGNVPLYNGEMLLN